MELDYNDPVFSISMAAKILKVSVHTLRMYEKEGLIIPFKKDSKQRLYSKSDIDRLECIRRAINENKISIAGIKTIFSLIPCYKIKNCGEKRFDCEAYNEHTKPCWMLKHESNFCSDKECRTCEVYMQFANCQVIKEKFLELLT
ncbi:MAG: MerR family transcriptional regulator [Ignavibacteriae bacterium]|nr:MAG: MerR family transcriptional regulator [Ignavibacteriota bacterium]